MLLNFADDTRPMRPSSSYLTPGQRHHVVIASLYLCHAMSSIHPDAAAAAAVASYLPGFLARPRCIARVTILSDSSS